MPRSHGTHSRKSPQDPSRARSRRLWRILTHNVTITAVAVGVLAGGVVLVDLDAVGGDAEPPPGAGDLSTNDMLAKLQASDMDPVVAGAVAEAKKRAHEEHEREMRALREKAKRDARAAAELKRKQEAERERERLATSNPSSAENQRYGRKMAALRGWDRCWPSLKILWTKESGWNERAENPSSGAYGIPQALPAEKLATAGRDWRTSSPTQIAWGLNYIRARYKDPCGAWAWWQAHHWY
ncbi:lytic transglycosylase domain-containing protein [Actinomadura kijaniata]|uniref:aggregation-promoting factor C-terminal-like domain-containing protein n=1 Tax=Actinomadura kijaniata TaxID=46161 RepID=UPI00083077D8|nr:lytic transglycosylase domain-containing protein [Actinomadura kijaniata]